MTEGLRQAHRNELVANRAQQHDLRRREMELQVILNTLDAVDAEAKAAAAGAPSAPSAPGVSA